MDQEDVLFIDELKKHWFSGKTEKTPTEILVNIPAQVYRLIKIIDTLSNENIDLKNNKKVTLGAKVCESKSSPM